MSFLSKLFAKSAKKKAQVEADKASEKKVGAGVSGTVLRPDSTSETREKPKTLLEIAVAGDWEVKQVAAFGIGDVIDGQYKVEKIFSGGMGHVYIAKSENQHFRFAIKQPNEMMLANKSFFGRVLREADAWTGLGMHPHIAYCYFVKKIEGIPHIFIEYVDGNNLREWIADGRCADFKTGLEMCIQFCHGMEHAHSKGMMHRDIKPENVLTANDGTVKVTDFGLAGEVEKGEGRFGKVLGGGDLTRIGDVMGTEEYMSPEQWENPREVGPESDIFSFGVCMWEMFCGRRPYEVSIGDVGPPPDTHELRPDIPDGLSRILYKSTDLDKDKRHKYFAVLREELNDLYKELFSEDAPSYRIDIPDSLAAEYCNRGYSYYQLGDEKRAEECWDKALEADPHHPEATYNRGLLLWRSARMTDDVLVKQLEEVRTTHEGDWRDEYYLGLVHMERGDAESAIKVLEEASNETPDEDDLQRALAIARSGQGKWRFCLRTFKGHTESVSSVCFSSDGRWAFSASDDQTLRLWEIATGKCVRTFEGHKDAVRSVSFSPDGQWVLSGSSDKTLKLWEIATGKCVRNFEGHKDKVWSVSFSSEGRMALSGSSDKTLKLWEAATGKCVRTFEGHKDAVRSVSFSPDGRWALSGSDAAFEKKFDKTLKLWEIATGKCVRTFEGQKDSVHSVSFSPDGQWVLSGSSDNTLRLWEIATGKCVRTFEGHTEVVRAVTLSPDGYWAISAGNDRTLRLWELATGRCVRTFERHTSSVNTLVNTVSISPDGQWVLSGSYGKTIRLWELRGPGPVGGFAVTFPLSTAEISIAAIDASKAIEKAKSDLKQGLVSDAAAEVGIARRIPGFERHPELLELWREVGKRGRISSFSGGWFRRQYKGHTRYVSSVSISPEGRMALSGSRDETLKLWEIATGKCVKTFLAFSNVLFVSISSDGLNALSGSGNGEVSLWELDTAKNIRSFKPHWSGVESATFSPDGRLALSGGCDNTLKLWELATKKCIRTFEGHSHFVMCVSISPDGRWALSGSSNKSTLSGSKDKTLKLWELATGKCIRTFEGHTNHVICLSISPDSRWALTASLSDNTQIRLWDVITGKCVRAFEGYQRLVTCAIFSPDGQWVLSGSSDNMLRLWEIATGKCVRTFEGHTGSVRSVCFSSDGHWALSGSEDKTIRLWELVWDYEFPEPTDWDEGARPYLETFMTLHCPYGDDGISRVGKPSWNDDDFNQLLKELQYRGYGWLRPEGVRRELEKMTNQWKGPPTIYK